MTYERPPDGLAEVGVDGTAANIRNKVARGGFSAVFFAQYPPAMKSMPLVRINY